LREVLTLRDRLGPGVAFDHNRADPALAQLDGEPHTDRAAANDDNLRDVRGLLHRRSLPRLYVRRGLRHVRLPQPAGPSTAIAIRRRSACATATASPPPRSNALYADWRGAATTFCDNPQGVAAPVPRHRGRRRQQQACTKAIDGVGVLDVPPRAYLPSRLPTALVISLPERGTLPCLRHGALRPPIDAPQSSAKQPQQPCPKQNEQPEQGYDPRARRPRCRIAEHTTADRSFVGF